MSHIGVDIDDVMYPWYDAAHRLSVAAGIGTCTPTSWAPYEDYGCTAEQWYEVLGQGAVTGDLYRDAPMPGAIDALRRLRQAGHTIHLVTARGLLTNGHLIRGHTVTWLHEHDAPFDTLTFSKDKSIVRTDYFVDDNVGNLQMVESHTDSAGILITRPWNAELFWPARDRYDSLSTFVDSLGAL